MKKIKKKVLVVGGAGYLGGAVTDILFQHSDRYDIRVYDNLLYEESYRKPIDFIYGDILDTKKLKTHLKWADAVIWLAAIVGEGACALNEPLTVQLNQKSVEWLVRNFKKRIVFASTCSVYGAQNETLLDEVSAISPLSLYAATKVESEKLLAKSDAVIYRLGTLFGVSDAHSRIRMDLVVNFLTASAFLTKQISIFGGNQYRPLLHVCDAAQYMVEALQLPKLKKAEIVNIAHSNMQIGDLARKIKMRFPAVKIQWTDMPFEDTRNYQASIKKAHRLFKFRPQFSVDDGIEQILNIVKHKRVKDFKNPRYSNLAFLKGIGL